MVDSPVCTYIEACKGISMSVSEMIISFGHWWPVAVCIDSSLLCLVHI